MVFSQFRFMSGYSLGAVILAAGRSSRMGQPKLLLPWGKTSVLGYLLQQWQELGAKQIAVVCAADDAAMAAELDKLGIPGGDRIINPNPERGMFSSIQCAARWDGWQAGLTHWAVALGDQPHLRFDTLRTILDFSVANKDKVCQPRKDGHRHHPVLLPRNFFEHLSGSATGNLKDFLASCDTAYCEMNDPGLELDIDRPEDYQRARKLAEPEEP
jgi:molybdenum cofactor cytidylyltransferase